jgi:hypothetical protein
VGNGTDRGGGERSPAGSLVAMLKRGGAVLTLLAVLLAAGCGRALPRPPGTSPAASPPATPVVVTFTTPDGFVATSAYTILVPLTPHHDTQWRVPSGSPAGLDVLFVNSYVLDRGVDTDSPTRLLARIAGYARQVKATRATTPSTTTVDGRTAYQQHIEQPDADRTLHYDTTYIFTDRYLVQVGCQWDHHQQTIQTACQKILNTLEIGAV